jgi:hypothetical protein
LAEPPASQTLNPKQAQEEQQEQAEGQLNPEKQKRPVTPRPPGV